MKQVKFKLLAKRGDETKILNQFYLMRDALLAAMRSVKAKDMSLAPVRKEIKKSKRQSMGREKRLVKAMLDLAEGEEVRKMLDDADKIFSSNGHRKKVMTNILAGVICGKFPIKSITASILSDREVEKRRGPRLVFIGYLRGRAPHPPA